MKNTTALTAEFQAELAKLTPIKPLSATCTEYGGSFKFEAVWQIDGKPSFKCGSAGDDPVAAAKNVLDGLNARTRYRDRRNAQTTQSTQ